MANHRIWTIVLTVVITAIVVSSGIYWWQSLQFDQKSTQETTQITPNATKTQSIQKSEDSIFAKIKQELTDGKDLTPTKKPSFILPSDINEAQIENYYLLGDVFMALVRRSSMNVYLEALPPGFNASFAGIIAADSTTGKWKKILTIRDSNTTDKNNPYAIWTDGGYKTPQRYLFLTVVDQNGAGSGEGFMKLLTSSDAKQWSQEQCYYFDSHVQGENYFLSTATEISEGGSGFEKYSGKECNNFRLITE